MRTVIFMLGLLLVAAATARADSIQLHPQAVVGGTEITLGDVAELEGPAARALGSLVVGRFPTSAVEVTVTFDTVQRHLHAAAVNLSALTVRGARSCRVANADARDAPASPVPITRPAPVADVVTMPSPLRSDVADVAGVPEVGDATDTTVAATAATATGATRTSAVPTVSQRITRQLERLTLAEPGALAITFRGSAEAAARLNDPAPAGDVEITVESRTGLGSVPVRVRTFSADGQVYETRLNANVVQRVGVAVVTAPIRRGDRFTAENVSVQAVELDRRHGTPIADLDAVLGRAASASLQVGTPVIERHLAPDVLVERGDLVTVTVRRGRLSIRTVGRAAEDGTRGAIIALRNDATREQFYATVTGPRRAVIEPGQDAADGGTPRT